MQKFESWGKVKKKPKAGEVRNKQKYRLTSRILKSWPQELWDFH